MYVAVTVEYDDTDHEYVARFIGKRAAVGYGDTEAQAINDLKQGAKEAAKMLSFAKAYGKLKDRGNERIIELNI